MISSLSLSCVVLFFFFSSRRRHTRYIGDWSSDVCSSDLMTFLRRQLRERDMRELLLGGELINAKRALEIGLVNRVVPAEEVMNEALKFADSVLQGAPNAVLQTKQMIEELWSTSVKDDLERALKHHMQARGSTEGREGITAFNEKRKPNWTV